MLPIIKIDTDGKSVRSSASNIRRAYTTLVGLSYRETGKAGVKVVHNWEPEYPTNLGLEDVTRLAKLDPGTVIVYIPELVLLSYIESELQ